MFVKTITDMPEGRKKEQLYQCDRISVEPMADNQDSLFAVLERDVSGYTVSLEIRKSMMEMYVMNDNGQTIESYRWR